MINTRRPKYVVCPCLQCCSSDRQSTQVRKSTLLPEWNEYLEFSNIKNFDDMIEIQVKDWDRFSKDDTLGTITLPLAEILGQVERGKFSAIEEHEILAADQESSIGMLRVKWTWDFIAVSEGKQDPLEKFECEDPRWSFSKAWKFDSGYLRHEFESASMLLLHYFPALRSAMLTVSQKLLTFGISYRVMHVFVACVAGYISGKLRLDISYVVLIVICLKKCEDFVLYISCIEKFEKTMKDDHRYCDVFNPQCTEMVEQNESDQELADPICSDRARDS